MKSMRKFVFAFVLVAQVLLLSGCGQKEEVDVDAPAFLREAVGEIVAVKLDLDGDILIDKNDITTEATYYVYNYDGVAIGLLAVRDSNGNVRVVVNTCQSCKGSPYAYFVQVGNQIQCQNCGSVFDIDSLGELESGGCNPIGIESIEDDGDTLKISHKEIEQYKSVFKNWKGPTV